MESEKVGRWIRWDPQGAITHPPLIEMDSIVDIELRNGEIGFAQRVDWLDWSHENLGDDIVWYRENPDSVIGDD